MDRAQWPAETEIESFFPLGFSSDGWFAYSSRLADLCLEEPLGHCRDQMLCFDVSLFNVTCDRPCAGDFDPDAGAKCRCLRGIAVRDLEDLGVRPQRSLEFGEFPVRVGGVDYDVELTYREKALYSEVMKEPRQPEFPETRVFLLAGLAERRLVGEIDHNHSDIAVGVRVAGWLKYPGLDRIIVLLLSRRTWANAGGSSPYFLLPIAAELGTRPAPLGGGAGQQQPGSR